MKKTNPQELDKKIISLWTARWNPLTDLPNLRFELEQVAGLPKDQVDEILSRIKPEDLAKIYSDDTETK